MYISKPVIGKKNCMKLEMIMIMPYLKSNCIKSQKSVLIHTTYSCYLQKGLKVNIHKLEIKKAITE